MFWKKKSDKPDGNKLFKVPDQSRGAFRVAPAPEDPIVMKMGGADVPVLDISSGGLSFKNVNYKVDTPYEVSFQIPHSNTIVKTKLKILRISYVYNLVVLLGYWPEGKILKNPDNFLEDIIERKLSSFRVGRRILN